MKKKICLIVCSFITVHTRIFDVLPVYDRNITPFFEQQKKRLLMSMEYGFSGEGRNQQGEKVDATRFLSSDQNALAMLKGSLPGTELAALAQQINVDDDDGVRGHFVTSGSYNVPFSAYISFAYQPFAEWSVYAHLPIMYVKMDTINWVDQTKNVTLDDALTHTLLTDNFFAHLSRLANLDVRSWEKKGCADTTFIAAWNRRFLQQKEWLKEVALTLRAGITFPTGIKKDENKAFSLAFGNDGAYAFPFGAGIDLRFKKYLWAGVDISFEHIFSHTKERRIMTDASQTNYLFAHTALARREHGMVQRFNIYIEPQLYNGFSFRCAYQHSKKGEDYIYLISHDYAQVVANKAQDLKEYSTHHIITQIKWDHKKVHKHASLQPEISLFARIPFNGKNVLQSNTIGCSLVFDF